MALNFSSLTKKRTTTQPIRTTTPTVTAPRMSFGGLNLGSLGVKKPSIPTAPTQEPRIKTVDFPKPLGGGQFKVSLDDPQSLILTTRSQKALGPAKPGQERDHIISVALGGTSNINNLEYKPSPRGEDGKWIVNLRQGGKVEVETDAIEQYKKGEISLTAARAKILQKQRQITGLEPTEEEKTFIGQLAKAAKERGKMSFIERQKADVKSTGKMLKDFGGLLKKAATTFLPTFEDVKTVRTGVQKVSKFIEPKEEDIVDREMFERTGTGVTRFGEIITRNPKTGELSSVDVIGGVGKIKDIAKEGIEEGAKKLLQFIKKSDLGDKIIKFGKKEAIDMVKQIDKLPAERIIKAPRLDLTGIKKTEPPIAPTAQVVPDIKAVEKITIPKKSPLQIPKFMNIAKESIAPIKAQDDVTQSIFKKWNRKVLSGAEEANTYANKIPEVDDNFQTVLKYERGETTAVSKVIKKEFDKLFKQAEKAGLDIGFKANYIPQRYQNSTEEIMEATANYMKAQGVDQKIIDDYVKGITELSKTETSRLKLNPSFSKERALPNYKTAMNFGLTPKYSEPGQLLASYKLELDKTIANKNFIDDLAKKGKITTVQRAGGDFEPVTLPFSPKGYYAPPKLAKMLNGMFRNEEALGITQTFFKKFAGVSKLMQEITLSAGIPFTGVNFFSLGLGLVKPLTAGEMKAASAFVRSNFNKRTIKYFAKNKKYLELMANQGIDVSNRAGNFEDYYKKFSNIKGINKKLGFTWDKMFQEKTFNNLLPMNFLDQFKGTYDKAIKQGLSHSEAEKLAGDVTKKFNGLYENLGRGKGTDDALSSIFFAPKFREGIVNTLFNTAKSISTEVKNPAFYKNRKLMAGMMLSYGAYNALNKKLTGHYMWDNPSGKEFELMVPTEKGEGEDDVVYVPFMPSFLAFARNMGSGLIAAGKGDINTAQQKFGSLFSMPVKLISEIWANKDYFGREIFDEDADAKTQKKQILGYTFGFSEKGASGGINHPFVREIYNQIKTDKPLYQSMAQAMEFPIKFSSMSKIEASEYYDAVNKLNVERDKVKADFKPKYNEIQEMIQGGDFAEAQAEVDALSDEDYELYQKFKSSDTAKEKREDLVSVFSRFKQIQELKETNPDEAQSILNEMTDSEYKQYKKLKDKFKDFEL